jgi:hypothetical protein
LIRLQREAEIIRPIIRNVLSRAGNLPDDDQIISLRFFVHGAVARKSRHQIVVKPARLLAGYSGELYKRRDGSFFVLAQIA